MILSALYKRLKAIEPRPTAQRPLQIVGGLPSGSAMLEALAAGARTATDNAIDAATWINYGKSHSWSD
jgi:hypothetical protein